MDQTDKDKVIKEKSKIITDVRCDKTTRILSLYNRLHRGAVINKKQVAWEFAVDIKTVQRDIEDLKAFLEGQTLQSSGDFSYVKYDRARNGYFLDQCNDWLTQEEVLGIAKIVLESRALPKSELFLLLDKLILQCSPEARRLVKEVIANERLHYLSVGHSIPLLQNIWDISRAIRERYIIRISYLRAEEQCPINRTIEPWGLIFSEYYFYVIAYVKDSGYEFPAVYRLDRIESYKITGEHFRIDEKNRFEEGEFRKRVQFMRSGRLKKITFRFWGPSLQAVLDRLPTAKVIGREDNKAIVEAEVFGSGIKMWLLSQAEYLEVLKPDDFRQDMKETLRKMIGNYK